MEEQITREKNCDIWNNLLCGNCGYEVGSERFLLFDDKPDLYYKRNYCSKCGYKAKDEFKYALENKYCNNEKCGCGKLLDSDRREVY